MEPALTARQRRYAEDQGAADARPDDAGLIERSWHEPEAFAALYDRHAAPLSRRIAPVIAVDPASAKCCGNRGHVLVIQYGDPAPRCPQRPGG